MACCAVIAVVIGLVRAAWFRVAPGARPAETPFAPPVRRELGAPAPLRSTTATSTATATTARPRLAPPVLTGVALGTLAYTAFVAAALVTGLAERRPSELWLPRDLALLVLAGGAAALGMRTPVRELAPVLLGAGIAWSELALVDMHLLRLFNFAHLALPLDLMLHGAGFLLVLLTLPRVLAPTRQTVTA